MVMIIPFRKERTARHADDIAAFVQRRTKRKEKRKAVCNDASDGVSTERKNNRQQTEYETDQPYAWAQSFACVLRLLLCLRSSFVVVGHN